ncbi:MAG TPA: MotA/TolQ/ExbB proton channel family protein [Candidatus Glassbacteria bacterium]|nr:MotA/TolQ/ExbB proton channel family protein [Candidatus Glassbacteria bacterium]
MGREFVSKLLTASPEAQLIYIILGILSVMSWMIMGRKFFLLRRAENEVDEFVQRFRKARDLDGIQEAGKGMVNSPVAALVNVAVNEVRQVKRLLAKNEERKTVFDPTVMMRDTLLMALERTVAEQGQNLRSWIVFLAITTTVSPFLGLLGTVWGIMIAFLDIAAKGSANITVVAPGIADALNTTIVGLVVAIPAVVGYNYLTTRARRILDKCNNFSLELAGIIYKSSLNI